ncbi:antibiotic biosynthesis monooxygenase [Actinocorallia sp. API 0066]|uniref:putative quinol monooxygenase n=1 Tax=Actinocorallia sp. API 0066 TaxID=2896846 RepID=UPI001E581C35|nr:antibiotic biosynthesis monooxygenase family protein [Actinocorallia sp. API 0066]MCD0447907.1 antibiotic biosynthesis monooxygenase [Actinocorallia sp. API 0066]
MTCQVVFELHVKKEHVDNVRQWFVDKLPGTRAFRGNVSVEVVREQDDPTKFVFMEKWNERKDFEDYLAWRVEEGTVAELAEMLEGDIDFRYFEPLGV